MARLHFVKSAQKDIYVNGKTVQYESKRGKRAGQMKSKLDRTIPENKKDKLLVAKGESYYWWQFKNGGKNISKTRPKDSELTQSPYLAAIYDFTDELNDVRGNVSDVDDLQSFRDDIVSRLEELRDEQEEKKSNMPEGLQEGPTGELLQERYDSLDSAIDEINSVDLDDYDEPDEDDLRDDLKDEVDASELNEPEEDDPAHDEWDEDEERRKLVTDAMIEEKRQKALDQWLDERCDDLSGISFG